MLDYNQILTEALRDDIPDYMKGALKDIYGKAKTDFYLDKTPRRNTSNIKNGEYLISQKQKNAFLERIFGVNISKLKDQLQPFIQAIFASPKFYEYVTACWTRPTAIIWDDLWITDLYTLVKMNNFKLIEVNKSKTEGKVCVGKNVSNINRWIPAFNRATGENIPNPFTSDLVASALSLMQNSEYKFDAELFSTNELYLYVTDRADDTLRMSISQFYDSCQNLYTGGANEHLLSTVFDPNSKLAYVILKTPYKDKEGNVHPFMALGRAILRRLEDTTMDNEGIVAIDTTYPFRVEDNMLDVLKEAGYNVHNLSSLNYTVNYQDMYGLGTPYMDSYSSHAKDLSKVKYSEEFKEEIKEITQLFADEKFDDPRIVNMSYAMQKYVLTLQNLGSRELLSHVNLDPRIIEQLIVTRDWNSLISWVKNGHEIPSSFQSQTAELNPRYFNLFFKDKPITLDAQIQLLTWGGDYFYEINPEIINPIILKYLLKRGNFVGIREWFTDKHFEKKDDYWVKILPDVPAIISFIKHPTPEQKAFVIERDIRNLKYLTGVEYSDELWAKIRLVDIALIRSLVNVPLNVLKEVFNIQPILLKTMKFTDEELQAITEYVVDRAISREAFYILDNFNFIPENLQIRAVSSDPRAILCIQNPSEGAIKKALELRPELVYEIKKFISYEQWLYLAEKDFYFFYELCSFLIRKFGDEKYHLLIRRAVFSNPDKSNLVVYTPVMDEELLLLYLEKNPAGFINNLSRLFDFDKLISFSECSKEFQQKVLDGLSNFTGFVWTTKLVDKVVWQVADGNGKGATAEDYIPSDKNLVSAGQFDGVLGTLTGGDSNGFNPKPTSESATVMNYGSIVEELRDSLPKYMQDEVKSTWGELYLDEEPRRKIVPYPDGEWLIPPEFAREFLASLFKFDIGLAQAQIKNFVEEALAIPKFEKYFKESYRGEKSIDLHNLWTVDLLEMKKQNFAVPSIKESIAAGQLIFRKSDFSKSGFTTWLTGFNKVVGSNLTNPFMMNDIHKMVDVSEQTGLNMEIVGPNISSTLYLYVSGKPDDVLRMSLSKFYDSCQNLYTGIENSHLLSNVFDKRMKVAYVIMKTPYKDNYGNIHPFSSLSRVILRERNGKVYIEKSYPLSCFTAFKNIIEQNLIGITWKFRETLFISGNGYYKIDSLDKKGLEKPYMDSLFSSESETRVYIDAMTKEEKALYFKLHKYLSSSFNAREMAQHNTEKIPLNVQIVLASEFPFQMQFYPELNPRVIKLMVINKKIDVNTLPDFQLKKLDKNLLAKLYLRGDTASPFQSMEFEWTVKLCLQAIKKYGLTSARYFPKKYQTEEMAQYIVHRFNRSEASAGTVNWLKSVWDTVQVEKIDWSKLK